jgi:uncharacterized UPF0146 family protein
MNVMEMIEKSEHSRSKTLNLHEYYQYIQRNEIPPFPPKNINSFNYFEYRTKITTKYNLWTIIDKIWTKELANFINNNTVLEVMSGAGWLAKALLEHNIDIIATDNYDKHYNSSNVNLVHDVEKIDARDAVKKYKDVTDILLICWPPYNGVAILDVCQMWGPNKPIIYIGENYGGCNAPDEFFEHFQEIDNPPAIPMHRWYGIHDYVMIGHYK